MTGGLTADELLAEQTLAGASKETQALGHGYAGNLANRLPGVLRNAVGEALLQIAGDIDALVRTFTSKGMDPLRAIGVVTKMLSVAGVELYIEGMSAQDVADCITAAVRSATP